MGPLEIGVLALVAMVVLIYAGVHVAIALAATSYIGVWLVRDSQLLASRLLAIAAEESINSYIFGGALHEEQVLGVRPDAAQHSEDGLDEERWLDPAVVYDVSQVVEVAHVVALELEAHA